MNTKCFTIVVLSENKLQKDTYRYSVSKILKQKNHIRAYLIFTTKD